jgi:hypothetical protein
MGFQLLSVMLCRIEDISHVVMCCSNKIKKLDQAENSHINVEHRRTSVPFFLPPPTMGKSRLAHKFQHAPFFSIICFLYLHSLDLVFALPKRPHTHDGPPKRLLSCKYCPSTILQRPPVPTNHHKTFRERIQCGSIDTV